jgi:acyl-CoA synthetase (AMP-forming)/AMP-acid ligase II
VANFYNYIHNTLNEAEDDELVFWPDQDKTAGLKNKDLLQHISNYRYLLQPHVQPGEPVLLAIPASIASINALLAIQSIGAIPVIPPAKAGIKVLLSTIKKQNIKVVIIRKKPGVLFYLFLKLAGLKYLYLNNTIDSSNLIWQPAAVPPDQPALITYSSGTTGESKGIFRSHRVLSAQHLLIKKLFPAEKKRRDFPLFPNVILHNLASGVASILPDIKGFQVTNLNPERIVFQLESHQIETLTGNVFYFKRIAEHLKDHPQSFPKVKILGIGGSPVPENLVPALKPYFPNAVFCIIYGSSEAEPIAIRAVQEQMENPLNGFAVGIPCEELEFRVSRSSEIHTPNGSYAAGEIEVKGQHVATLKEDGWLSTGDIGYLTPENKLYLTARIGNERPHQGIQHFQIEHLLVLQEGIQQAAAISVDDGFLILVQGSVSREDVLGILNSSFSPDIIKSIELMAQIPVDNRHQSKVLYHKLKK